MHMYIYIYISTHRDDDMLTPLGPPRPNDSGHGP